jgi:hypothetical protein
LWGIEVTNVYSWVCTVGLILPAQLSRSQLCDSTGAIFYAFVTAPSAAIDGSADGPACLMTWQTSCFISIPEADCLQMLRKAVNIQERNDTFMEMHCMLYI